MCFILTVLVLIEGLLSLEVYDVDVVPAKHKQTVIVQDGPFGNHVGFAQVCVAPCAYLADPRVENTQLGEVLVLRPPSDQHDRLLNLSVLISEHSVVLF